MEASRFPKACVSERPTFLISWFSMMPCVDPSQMCKINIGHLSFSKIITKYNLWIFDLLPQFIQMVPFTTLQWSGDGNSTYQLSFQDAKERPREWLNISFSCKHNGKVVTLWKTTCNKFVYRLRHCANYRIIWKRSRIDKNLRLLVDFFWWPFWLRNDAFVTAEHHAWEFFNSFHVLLVLVNSRPANCDSLMVLG